MITITKQPYLCALSKNSIDFVVTTDLQYDTATVFPALELSFLAIPAIGSSYVLTFTNPESGKTETIDFVAVDGTSPNNYKELWQIPGTGFSGSLADLRTIVFEKSRQRKALNAFYNIELPIIEFGGSVKKFTLTAKQAISQLVFDYSTNQASTYISEVNSVAYHQPGVRDGYALNASLFLETNYNSGKFNFVTTIDLVLDENSTAHVDFGKYIDAEIEASWNEYPVPFEQELGYIAPNLRRYYVVFSENYSNNSIPFETKSETLLAHWGGVSSDDFYNSEPIAAQNTSGNWLTWWPSGKRILKEQSDWLAWMNGAEIEYLTTEATAIGSVVFEGESVTHEFSANLGTLIKLNAFETYIVNTGFDINFKEQIEQFIIDSPGVESFTLQRWEIRAYKSTDTLNAIFTQIGGSQVANTEWEIDSYHNGRRQWGSLSENNFTIQWNDRWELFYNHYGAGAELIGYSNSIEQIPIGEFIILENEYWEAANVLNVLVDYTNFVYFTYYPEKSCLTKQIVYFNSFGVPESFILSAEFQHNITTSQELATRTESYALNNLLPQNYIFDAKNVISYQAETMMLSNLEAERLMPLVNSTITFLLEKGNFIPVIINAGTTAIYKVNSFLQKIKLDLVRANESDRVSYFEVLPDFEPFYSSGILWLDLKRNGLNITDFGSIKAYFEGEEIEEFTYQSTQKYYIASDAFIQEGIITFVLTCEVNGAEIIVRKQYNYKWEQMDWVFYATADNLLFRIDLRGAFADQPFRIDWGDGTSEDLEITNSITNYTHTYSEEGKYFIRVFKPSFSDLRYVKLFDKINYFDFAPFTGMQDLILEFGSAGKYYLNGIKDLETINIKRTTIEFLNLGFQRNLEVLTLDECVIDSDVIDALLLELWTFRKGYLNAIAVTFTDLGHSPSAFATSIVNGTGVYAGDGLNEYSITVTFS